MTGRTFKIRLFATSAFGVFALLSYSHSAEAQTQPTPPEHYTLDERGVDLVTGQFVHQAADVMIGEPGNGGLVHARVWANGGWRDVLSGTIAVSGSTYVVSLGAESEVFTQSGSTFTPVSNRGATLVQTTPTLLTFTRADGTVATYSTSYSGSTMAYQANNAALMSVRQPNGDLLTLAWDGVTYCKTKDRQTGQCLVYANATRINAVTSNRGYQINFTYASNTPPDAPEPPSANWLRRTAAVGINLAVDYCSPEAHGCTGLTQTWPSVTYSTTMPYGGRINSVTDQSGRTTTYGYDTTSGRLSSIRAPGSTSDDISIGYGSGDRVSSVTDASGTWAYTYADAGTTRTTTASGPLSQQLVVVSDQTIGRATSVANALSEAISYAYDSQRRLKRVTQPEGDYAEVDYDGRGNVTQTTFVPKSGSGLANITTSATYPATCSNPVICNLPTSTTDALGKVTNYTWDSTHGGPLTITAPAPTAGVSRPQTRYAYAPQTAYYKNSAGSVVASATSVTLPTTVSACATGTSCTGTANEVRTTIVYGSAGVANNLMPTSVSRGSGAAPSLEITTLTYTPASDVATIDGPLPGSGDTTLYRYDSARQLVGVIGPDPDAGGSALNRAQRLTYNPRGQVTLAEIGTTPGYSDANWASFNPLLKNATTYDGYGRPTETRQQAGDGTTASVQQASYDAAGRRSCTAVRMNPATFGALPSSACTAATLGAAGPDRIGQITYNSAGRVLAVTSAYGLPEAITESVTYTSNGLLASLTDGKGNVSVLEYDGFNRMSKLRYPSPTGGGTSTTDYESYTYDAAGRIVARRDRADATTILTWDALGRITNVDAPSGTTDVATTYDNLGRVLTKTVSSQTLTNAWDPLSRLTSESGPLGEMGYQYDAGSRLIRITWPDAFYVTYHHNLYGDVTAVRENGVVSGVGVLATYGYNDLGKMTGTARAGGTGVSTTYGYDAFARLTSLAHNASGTVNDVTLDFGYNSAGQLTSRTMSNASYVYAPVTGSTAYGVDGLNRVATVAGNTVTYDANQNITGVTGSTYSYDAANRLTSANAGATTFAYDPVNRLYQSSAAGASTRFQYAGAQMTAEYDGAGAMIRRHIPGHRLDGTLTSYEGSGTTNRTWLLTDERGSVSALAGETGGVSSINRFDEYGVPAAANIGRFQYTGQMWLPEAEVYHYKARAYAPQLGRFLQPDPISYAAGANLYAYVGADPINLLDPFGLQTTTPSDPPPIVNIGCGMGPNGFLQGSDCPTQYREPLPYAGGFRSWIFGGSGAGNLAPVGGSNFGSGGGPRPGVSPGPTAPPAQILHARITNPDTSPLECRNSNSGWNSLAEGALVVSNISSTVAMGALGAAAFTSWTGVGGVSFGTIAAVSGAISLGASVVAAVSYTVDGNPAGAGTVVGGLAIGGAVGGAVGRAVVGQGTRTIAGTTLAGAAGGNIMSGMLAC